MDQDLYDLIENDPLGYVYSILFWYNHIRFSNTVNNSLTNANYIHSWMVHDFTNTPDVEIDLNNLQDFYENTIQFVNKAVLLTNYDYSVNGGDIYGIAHTIPGDVAIVEVAFGIPTWVMTHEVGHLFGGRHDNDVNAICERAWVSGSLATPIKTGFTPVSRLEYYSDPATYGATDRWNAGIIQNYWCGSL